MHIESLALIIAGAGKRTAESYSGDQAGAPLLHVEYMTGLPNDPPLANADSASTSEGTPVAIDLHCLHRKDIYRR